eukprot:COSAG04_NODE_127_length_24502_cov_31.657583_15_plen_471_part_00
MRQSPGNEAMLTENLRHLFHTQMALGFFDPPELDPYSKLNTKDDVDTPAARALAKEAAEQSITLLVNREGTLPLRSDVKRLALIGPNANATTTMQGNYATSKAPLLVSPLDGFRDLGLNVEFAQGTGVGTPSEPAEVAAAVAAAKRAEAVCVVVGLDGTQEGEGHDRTSLLLPGNQTELVEAVAAAASKPIVVIVMSGSGLDVSALVANPKVGAIMWSGYPGQSGGTAIAEAVMGLQNPAGRLPMTWYFSNFTSQVKKTQMALRPSAGYPGRTHRFFDAPVLFSFGAGTSYTTFAVKLDAGMKTAISLQQARAELERSRDRPHEAPTIMTAQLSVENTGSKRGAHTVRERSPCHLARVVDPEPELAILSGAALPVAAWRRPRREATAAAEVGSSQPTAPLAQRRWLMAQVDRACRQFERVAPMEPGGSASVALTLTAHDFALAGSDGSLSIAAGIWKLSAGGSAAEVRVS